MSWLGASCSKQVLQAASDKRDHDDAASLWWSRTALRGARVRHIGNSGRCSINGTLQQLSAPGALPVLHFSMLQDGPLLRLPLSSLLMAPHQANATAASTQTQSDLEGGKGRKEGAQLRVPP